MDNNLETARNLIKKYLKDQNNQIHSRESEVVMRAVSKELNQDQEQWALAGLLHDLDWEQTSDNFPLHGIKIKEILEKENFDIPLEVLQAFSAHNVRRLIRSCRRSRRRRVGDSLG